MLQVSKRPFTAIQSGQGIIQQRLVCCRYIWSFFAALFQLIHVIFAPTAKEFSVGHIDAKEGKMPFICFAGLACALGISVGFAIGDITGAITGLLMSTAYVLEDLV